MRSDARPPVRNQRYSNVLSFVGLAALLLCVTWLTGCAGVSAAGSGDTTTPHLSGRLSSATMGLPYNGTISVIGGTAPYAFRLTSGSLPTGLTLSPNGGTISGTPGKSGVYNFAVGVADSKNSEGSQSFQITVNTVGSINVTVSPAVTSVSSSGTLQFTAAVANSSNVAVTWSASRGTISSSGLYQAPSVSANTDATVTATSSVDSTKSGSAAVTVTPSVSALSVATTSLPNATAGTTYSGILAATGGTTPYHWSIASGTLPTGITLAGSGLLSGTTTQAGQFTFTAQVADSSSPSKTATKSLALNTTGSITVTVSPAVTSVSSSGTLQFTAAVANSSNVAVTWSASRGTISSSGLYQAPSVSANTDATVTATSSVDSTKFGSAAVTVTPSVSALSVTTTSLANATAGTVYSATLSATGGTTPYHWSIASGTLPTGITLASSGLLSGTTSQTGQFTFTAQVVDSSSPSKTATKSLTLNALGSITVTVSPAATSVSSSGTLQFTAAVTNTSNVAVTWSASRGTISSSGLYQAPSVSANTDATVTATSLADSTKFGSAAVTVTPQVAALSVATTSLANATAGTAYSATLSATGGTTPYRWSLASGTLPTGITLAGSGLLSGTTTQTGQFTFTAQVVDSTSPSKTATKALTLTVSTSIISKGNTAPSTLFGFSATNTSIGGYPTVNYSMQRFWDSPPLQWPSINTASGVFDFNNLDATLATAYSSGVTEGMYTLARTPSWASSNPSDMSCNYATAASGGGGGECDPPNDLNSDGTGSNAIWKAWITGIASHVNNPTYLQTHAHIKYWEIWNEPDAQFYWNGSFAQLARLTEDANCIITGRGVIHESGNGTATACTATAIDPTAQIIMSSGHATGKLLTYAQNQLYCNASPTGYQLPCPIPGNAVASAVDIINFHMKPGNQTGDTCPPPTACTPESAMQMYISGIHGILQPAEQAKPLWDGEASYAEAGFTGAYTDVDMAASFLPRFYLIDWSLGISGIAWYDWSYMTTLPAPVQTSYQQTYNWLSGSSLSTPCAASGTVWSCTITKSGTQYLIMWDASQSCANGSCTTATQTVGSQWSTYQDITIANAPVSISGRIVPVGIKPVVMH